MSFTVVIPARYASTRLPGKPLSDIGGKTMVQRVAAQAQQSAASAVVVATDDERIQQSVEAAGGQCLMTRQDHPSGTDRLAEVAQQLQLNDDDIVVNVQGDEPLIPPAVIDQVASNLAAHSDCAAATLSCDIDSYEEFMQPSAVKVVADAKGRALYFSRAPIPWPRDLDLQPGTLPASFRPQRHLGIYAYRVSLLYQFVSWPKAPLEQLESLEQLRILQQGLAIHVEPACQPVPAGIDTPEDLERVRQAVLEQVG